MNTSGSSDRVIIDPEELRRVANRMRGGAEMLSGAGRHLATRPMPQLPVGLEGHVASILLGANRELQELSLELVQTAGELSGRATQAELGEIDSIAWLMPGTHGLVSLFAPRTPLLSLTGRSLESAPHREDWAESVLQRMGSLEPPRDRFIADDFADVVQGPDQDLGDMSGGGMMLDFVDQGSSAPESGTSQGAVSVTFDQVDLGPTGIGLAQCLVAGTGDDTQEPGAGS